MKIAIMQPYFFPYIGYFQLMNAVDEFVIYDNIEYTKKGWINRNRILVNGKDKYISLPLEKDSDYLFVKDRFLAKVWHVEKKKMLNRIIESYRKAPNFDEVFQLFEQCVTFNERNLFQFILNSLNRIKSYLEIETTLVIASKIPISHSLKAQEKVITICKERKANTYVNPIAGIELYSNKDFKNENITLEFLKSGEILYNQYNNDFVPWLSILDVMMFNSKEMIKEYLNSYYKII